MRRSGKLLAGLAAILALAIPVLASPAPAAPAVAELDCAQPASPFDAKVCGDPDLVRAYRNLTQAFQKALAQVPERWREALGDSQRAWLAYAPLACRANPDGEPPAPTCQRDMIDARADDLNHTTSRIAGKAFVTIVTYRTRQNAGRADDNGPPVRVWQTRLLQILQPEGPADEQWNAAMADRLTGVMAGDTALTAIGSVEIDSLAPGFIAATLRRYDTNGDVDGYDLTSIPWSLTLNRELKPEDLFTDLAAAKSAIADLTKQILMSQHGDQADGVSLIQIRRVTDRTDYWRVTAGGLDIHSGDVHLDIYSATIPWRDLASYLRRDLPFDVKALRAGSPRPQDPR